MLWRNFELLDCSMARRRGGTESRATRDEGACSMKPRDQPRALLALASQRGGVLLRRATASGMNSTTSRPSGSGAPLDPRRRRGNIAIRPDGTRASVTAPVAKTPESWSLRARCAPTEVFGYFLEAEHAVRGSILRALKLPYVDEFRTAMMEMQRVARLVLQTLDPTAGPPLKRCRLGSARERPKRSVPCCSSRRGEAVDVFPLGAAP